MNLDQTHAASLTTHWSLLGALATDDEAARRRAADALIRAYWPPVYGSLRRMGRGREEAQEITQEFFTEVVLGRGLLASADPARGRLRTLLLSALKNHLTDRYRRTAARGGSRMPRLGDIEREEQFLAAAASADPDALFDRRFALAALEEALRRCEAHYLASGRERNWKIFFARVLGPHLGSARALPLAALAAEHGFNSPADAAAAVQTVRKRLHALLREVVAETVADDAEGDDEYHRLLALVS